MNGCSAHGTKMRNMFVKEKQWWMGQNKMDMEQKGPGKTLELSAALIRSVILPTVHLAERILIDALMKDLSPPS